MIQAPELENPISYGHAMSFLIHVVAHVSHSYVVKKVEENATYHLVELDGTPLALPIAGKRIKIFKRRDRIEIGFEAFDDSILSIDEEL